MIGVKLCRGCGALTIAPAACTSPFLTGRARALPSDRILAVVLWSKEEDAVAGHVVTVITGHVLVNNGAHAVLIPEIAGLKEVLLILGVDVIGILLTKGNGSRAELSHKPVEGGLGVQCTAAICRALPAYDNLVLVYQNRHVLKKVAKVLRSLEDTGNLRVVHVELGYKTIAVDVNLRSCVSVLLPYRLNAGSNRFKFKHFFTPFLVFSLLIEYYLFCVKSNTVCV